MIFFFFSSRRRHTRYWRDWSSDVCSSDLGHLVLGPQPLPCHAGGGLLGLLLGPSLARAPGRPLEEHGGIEALGVVGALVADVVAGHLVEAPGGQLLEPRLVVLAPRALGGGGDP